MAPVNPYVAALTAMVKFKKSVDDFVLSFTEYDILLRSYLAGATLTAGTREKLFGYAEDTEGSFKWLAAETAKHKALLSAAKK